MAAAIKYRRLFLPFLLLAALLVTGCDDETVRQLGAKLAISGQGVGNSAVTTLNNLDALEAVDFQQRSIVKVVVQPEYLLTDPPADINKKRSEERRVGKECRSRW